MLGFIAALGLLAGEFVMCHPGEDYNSELRARGEFLRSHVANLDHCAQDLEASGVTERNMKRRLQILEELREKRGVINNNDGHNSEAVFMLDTDQALLFKSAASCVLAPEEMVGPYCK